MGLLGGQAWDEEFAATVELRARAPGRALMYLVDTSVILEARQGSPAAMTWLRSVDPAGIHLSVLTLGEILRGIALRQKSEPDEAGRLGEWLRKLPSDHADRILPVTDVIAAE